MNDGGQAAEEVLFLELVDELMLEFIRHQIAAIGIRANAQGVLYINEVLMADAVPESLTIGIGRTAFLFCSILACAREFSNRHRCRLGQLGIKLLLAFQAVDFLAEIYYIRFHLVVPAASSADTMPFSSRAVSRKAFAASHRFLRFSRSAKIVSIIVLLNE